MWNILFIKNYQKKWRTTFRLLLMTLHWIVKVPLLDLTFWLIQWFRIGFNFSKPQLWPKDFAEQKKYIQCYFGFNILKSGYIKSHNMTRGSKSSPWNVTFNLVMWTNTSLGVPDFLLKINLWWVSIRSAVVQCSCAWFFCFVCLGRAAAW